MSQGDVSCGVMAVLQIGQMVMSVICLVPLFFVWCIFPDRKRMLAAFGTKCAADCAIAAWKARMLVDAPSKRQFARRRLGAGFLDRIAHLLISQQTVDRVRR